MTETRDARIDRLRAVAATSHLRSPLARWLSANHDEFEKLLNDYRPRWEALVEQFAAEGLLELPPEFTSGDPHLRTMTRRRALSAPHRDPPMRFGPATLRGHTPSVPAPPRPATPAPEFDPARADRVIAALLAGQVKNRFAPKIDEEE
jgi:hypothetical protein